jgi:hypothetical protein
VTYRNTSLGPSGDEFVRGFTEQACARAMQQWEARLNHYLVHGAALVEDVATRPATHGSGSS